MIKYGRKEGGCSMSLNTVQLEKEFLEYVKKMSSYNEALALIYWDLRTGAPKKGAGQRSEVIGMLSSEVFKMSVSEEMAAYIANLKGKNISNISKRTLEECHKNYERNKKIRLKSIKNTLSFNQMLKLFGNKLEHSPTSPCSSPIWKSSLK